MSETSKASWIFNIALLAAAATAAYVIVGLTTENRALRAQLSARQSSPLDASYKAGEALAAVALRAGDRTTSLAALFERGGVAVFLTTTCPYCLQTLPTWSDLASDLEAAGVTFQGISFHPADLSEAYAREHEIAWPLWVLEDPSLAAQVRVASVPFTVLLDPGAVVRQVWLGPLGPKDVDALRIAALELAAAP